MEFLDKLGKKASEAYLNAFNLKSEAETLEKEITISSIKTATIEGNTVYYFFDENKNKYSAIITVSRDRLPFLNVGDKIKVYYSESTSGVNVVKDID